MVATLCLISCALAPAQPASGSDWLLTPRLSRGQELVYRGTFTEESAGGGIRASRTYRLDSRIFVLDASPDGADLALYTTLRQQAPRDERGAPAVTTEPGSVRLELARVNAQGRVTSGTGTSLLVPLSGPATAECGALVEVPRGRVRPDDAWETGEEGRPPRSWTVAGTESVNGTSCVKVCGVQQSEDWARPRADRSAWRRQDVVWLSPRLGVAYRVERTIEQREPARQEPSQRTVVRYELESTLVYPGQLLEERQREINQARTLAEAAEPLLREPGKFGPPAFEALLARISRHLDGQPPTPYRDAVLQVQRRVQGARRGEVIPAKVEEPAAPITVATVGQPAPDFVVPGLTGKQSVRLHRLLGKPVLMVFYNPASAHAAEILRFAQAVHDTSRAGVTVLGLAVSDDDEGTLKQYEEMKLGFPLLAGKGLRLAYALEATPKFFVLDADGVVRGSYIGWGREIPGATVGELKRLLQPAERR